MSRFISGLAPSSLAVRSNSGTASDHRWRPAIIKAERKLVSSELIPGLSESGDLHLGLFKRSGLDEEVRVIPQDLEVLGQFGLPAAEGIHGPVDPAQAGFDRGDRQVDGRALRVELLGLRQVASCILIHSLEHRLAGRGDEDILIVGGQFEGLRDVLAGSAQLKCPPIEDADQVSLGIPWILLDQAIGGLGQVHHPVRFGLLVQAGAIKSGESIVNFEVIRLIPTSLLIEGRGLAVAAPPLLKISAIEVDPAVVWEGLGELVDVGLGLGDEIRIEQDLHESEPRLAAGRVELHEPFEETSRADHAGRLLDHPLV